MTKSTGQPVATVLYLHLSFLCLLDTEPSDCKAPYSSTSDGGVLGSFEVSVNGTLVYSKLSTMAFPDFKNVTDIVSDTANGKDVVPVSKQQPIDCIIL
ncbi:hypothetical protein Cfor_05300 [Coptotermes formosanus]|uniref:Uncharacterized protein n=1 Tax=Coptotermes formosanus TaxID=36987 RepID=A0A6L2PAW5_COPFO|nr:hypothetical protein Cfor_05300 [Coptotermes formosanus]